ncbi:MAG: hypothetical protein C0501_00040 [Isosphaera sp.]|nr:hypothetical protein [Isosphaera sp.]
MRGTGPVSWGGKVVYAYYTVAGAAVRVRVSVDEAEGLGLTPGMRLRVGLPGRDPADVLVTRVDEAPPFAWVELAVMTPVARAG